MSLYVDTDGLKKTLGVTGTPLNDDLDAAAFAASDAIDEMCGSTFALSDGSNDEVRTFTPRGPGLVVFPDLASLTELAVDRGDNGAFAEVWTEGTDFVLVQRDSPREGAPYQWARARQRRWFPLYEQSVRITGRFGWETTPAAIVEAAGLLATQLFKRKREATFGIVQFNAEVAARIARTDPHICMLLDPYMRSDLA